MAINEKRMSIWGHLAELRRRFTIIAVALLVLSMVFFFFSQYVILFLLAPIAEFLPNPNSLPLEEVVKQTVLLDALEPFTLRFFVGFVTALVVSSPIWIWQILGFFLPALSKKERRWVIPTFAAAVVLFLAGTIFCYCVMLNPAFEFLTAQGADFGQLLPRTTNYVDTILLFLVAFGIAFELPIVIFYLTVFNIVPYKKLRKSWRMVYVVLLVLSAFVTPDASPVTMVLMFCALALLYEASLMLSRIVLSKRIKRFEAEAAAEQEAEARRAEARAAQKANDA
jgi:sec-independent protein translocase protein TatC